MDCSRMLMLGLLLNLAHGLEIMEDAGGSGGGGSEVEIQGNLTAVLGEEVYLRCLYRGNASITGAAWTRRERAGPLRLAGFSGGEAFKRAARLSRPASPTNLTARLRVTGVDAEGEYTCTFESRDREFTGTTFLRVHVRPRTEVLVTEEIRNGTHYQVVRCAAVDGKPAARISWSIGGEPPGGDHFSVWRNDTVRPNGVATAVSVLRFPTRLQDEGSVTCAVHHPALPGAALTAAAVGTFVAPRVSAQAEMMRRGEGEEEEDYWRVSCVASGGRPETHISLATAAAAAAGEGPRRETGTGPGTSAYRLPVRAYEGLAVSCVFSQPKLPGTQLRTVQLPSFYLSGVRLLANASNEMQLEEGQGDASLGLEAVGNVPRYAVFCQKEDASPLPSGVEMVGMCLTFRGPVGLLHAGLYACEASYYGHRATLRINVTVRPRPALVPPTITLDLRPGPSRWEVECSAAGAVPAAAVSWRLPDGVAGVSNVTSTPHGAGRHSVTGLLVLAAAAACLPRALTVGCVIHHPLFRTPENRTVTIPPCAPPDISLSSREEWRGGELYTVAQCRVDGIAAAATVTWRLGDGGRAPRAGGVDVWTEAVGWSAGTGASSRLSTVSLPTPLYSGQTLSCEVGGHAGLRRQERRHLLLPVLEAPALSVSVGRLGDSALCQAVCDYRAEGVKASLTWVLPAGSRGRVCRHSRNDGRVVRTQLTYRFPLASHEGDGLTCLAEYQRRSENRTIHIPKYYISSLRVLNQTTPAKGRDGHDVLGLSLQEDVPGQRILFHVEGNVPTHNITCQRGHADGDSAGSSVRVEGDALIFRSEVRGRDEGLYSCVASFHHHRARVVLRVEVQSPGDRLVKPVVACLAVATAAALVLSVVLWVFCKRNPGARSENQESLAAMTGLVQPLSFPEKSEAAAPGPDSQLCAHLGSYWIVSDVRSTL